MLNKSKNTLEYDKILVQVAEFAQTDGAKERILALNPAIYEQKVIKLLQETDDAKKIASLKGVPNFGGVKYCGDSVERAVKGATLAPIELLNIATICRIARSLLNYNRLNKKFETSIDEIFERLFANRTLEDKITRAIIAEDMISDEASAALGDIRRKIKAANSRVREHLQKYTSGASSKFLQENIVTIRNGRHVIPVKTEYKNEIKGLVHDTSSSGATLFVEPLAVVEINNEIKILEKKEKDEIERILSELSNNCAEFADEINLNYENITELAVIFAKSEYAFKIEGISPKIILSNDENYNINSDNSMNRKNKNKLFFYKARHPLLFMLNKQNVVPVDIGVGGDFDTLVITGPNTGGKTVSLKTLGLLVMMAQSGLQIPCADGSYMSVFEDVLADIGDEQSIEQSLSTFSAHMTNIVNILQNVSSNSLVLFDELGSGTDPVEGAALATAILESIHTTGALCAATTHYAELKVYALETSYAKNASCEFDVETLKPTYKLSIGAPGRSNAFAISSRLGMSDEIIERAKILVRSDNKKFENVLSKLEEDRLVLQKEKVIAAEIRREMERKNAETERELKRKLSEAEKNLEKSREEARRLIASGKASSNYIFAELEKLQKQKDEQDFKNKLTNMKSELKNYIKKSENDLIYSKYLENNGLNHEENVNKISDEDYILPRELKKGDKVFMKGSEFIGILESEPDKNGNVSIKAGAISVKTNVNKLRLYEENNNLNSKNSKENVNKNIAKKVQERAIKTVKTELDVRGKTSDEAWFEIDNFVDDAVLSGCANVRIIHGKGTGALRSALHKYFKSDSRIENFRLGEYGEGDSGVTILELK